MPKPTAVFIDATPEQEAEIERLQELAEAEREEISRYGVVLKARLESLGRSMRSAREKEGLTLDELAGRTGIDKATLSKMENGRANVTIETLSRYAAGLGREVAITFDDPAA